MMVQKYISQGYFGAFQANNGNSDQMHGWANYVVSYPNNCPGADSASACQSAPGFYGPPGVAGTPCPQDYYCPLGATSPEVREQPSPVCLSYRLGASGALRATRGTRPDARLRS